MKNLIFIGAPGSGKGSVAKLLKQHGYKHISTGDLLRAEVAKGTQLGLEINELISKGKFVDDKLSSKLTENNLNQSELFILDGYPRNVNQAQIFDKFCRVDFLVIYFDISKEELVDRLVNRVSCPSCGEIYNLKFKSPQVENTCDKCHSTLSKRSDDSLEFLDKRFELFNQYNSPLLDHYKNRIIKVDASKRSDLVVLDILNAIKSK